MVVVGRYPRVRLGILVVALTVAGAVFTFGGLVSVDEVRDAGDHLGPLAPLAFVVVSAVLAAVLVPGPVLAGASGLLFGAGLGTVVTLASAIVTAVLSLFLGRAGGLDGARVLLGPERAVATERLLARRGLLAVIGQRLLPGVPDAPASYVFGAVGARAWQVALGTLVGAAPRAFTYSALGASLDDPTSPIAIAGLVIWVVVSIAGAEVARRAWKRHRAERRETVRAEEGG